MSPSPTQRNATLRETMSEGQPRLLVSVRNVAEAKEAFDGGAAVIDIKEPRSGALGAASAETISAIVEFIAGRRPVTAALGELKEIDAPMICPAGIAVAKIGLAGFQGSDWQEKLATLAAQIGATTELAPTVYADGCAAGAPEPSVVIEFSAKLGLRWLLMDTWDKSSGDLLDYCPEPQLTALLVEAREAGLQVVLAGRLQGESLRRVSQLGPNLVGVRSAVCTGGREGQVSAALVASAADVVDLAAQSILRQDQPFPAKMAGL